MKAQDGRFFGGQRSMDHYGFRYFTYRNVSRRLEKSGSKGEDNNLVVSVRLGITEFVRASYDQCFME